MKNVLLASKLVKVFKMLVLSGLVSVAGGCSSDRSDLEAFMAEVEASPKGVIQPIPIFKPYSAFQYNAASKRAPFDIPVKVAAITRVASSSNVSPDFDRTKEPLEEYNLESLKMVGTLEREGTLWALIEDSKGSVHQVLKGNYMGKNHGKIIEVGIDYLSVIEIIPNGKEAWIERPRSLSLAGAGTI